MRCYRFGCTGVRSKIERMHVLTIQPVPPETKHIHAALAVYLDTVPKHDIAWTAPAILNSPSAPVG